MLGWKVMCSVLPMWWNGWWEPATVLDCYPIDLCCGRSLLQCYSIIMCCPCCETFGRSPSLRYIAIPSDQFIGKNQLQCRVVKWCHVMKCLAGACRSIAVLSWIPIQDLQPDRPGCDSTRALLGSAYPCPLMPLIPALSKPFVRFLFNTKSLS